MLNSFGQEINSYNMDKIERAIMNNSPIAEEAEEEAAVAAAGGIAPEDEKEIKGEGALGARACSLQSHTLVQRPRRPTRFTTAKCCCCGTSRTSRRDSARS
jgi:hypothetical protein